MENVRFFYRSCLMYKNKWEKVSEDFPCVLEEVSYKDKKANEIKIESLEKQIESHINKFPSSIAKKLLWRKKGDTYFKKVLDNEEILMIKKMNKGMREGIFETTKKFIKMARSFDSNLNMLDISQALRNLWIINILQETIDEKQKFSKAIFGYSMLYPYTDNFLDDNKITKGEKTNFNIRFYKRLKGEKISPVNSYEKKIFSLVENIEDTFKRNKYKDLYNSLLLIHKGQNKSLRQHINASISKKQLLDISIKKGGSSVLVDGFLVNGNLNLSDIEFLIGYGFFLQLGDDLQDIKEDKENSHNTIACEESKKGSIDMLANKLLNFIIELLDNYNWKDHSLKEVVLNNCINLVLFSVVLNKEFYSEDYIKRVSRYLPFSLDFIENLKKRYSDKSFENEKIMVIIDEIVS